MNPLTKDGLDTGTEFLKDSIAMSHLLLKRQLEGARNGKEIDWKAAMQVMKEGRAATKQIAQAASMELRERKLALQEKKAEGAPKAKPAPTPAKQPTSEDREKFLELSAEWMGRFAEGVRNPDGPQVVEYPEELKGMLRDYGLDPDKDRALDLLSDWLFPEETAVA